MEKKAEVRGRFPSTSSALSKQELLSQIIERVTSYSKEKTLYTSNICLPTD
jgi:hypothetical protein